MTPWGTIVSGEENWVYYFYRDAQDDTARAMTDKGSIIALERYSSQAGRGSRHGWESAGDEDIYQRWNNSVRAGQPTEDYRNEANTFGYIVEADPYDQTATLRKRTALGRFAHENAVFAPPVAGQPIVAYMGDDAKGEYIYKFVSQALWDPRDAKASNRLAVGDKYLDQGVLYVAQFHENGYGTWIELSTQNPVLANNTEFPFQSQADICIFTRLAADAVHATRMDRPEWGGVNPKNGEVYFTLTKNNKRSINGDVPVDSANPRYYTDTRMDKEKEYEGNVNGHIIRFAEQGNNRFRWDVYLFAAEPGADRTTINLSGLTPDNAFSSPDGLVFSQATGVCWIETDDSAYLDHTNCMLLAAIPGTVADGETKVLSYATDNQGEKTVRTYVGKNPEQTQLKRFLVGPKGAEITGLCETPDGKTLFVNIQHPGENTLAADINNPLAYESHWPANAGYGTGRRPRSATIAITKKDGGRVGS
jgi:secreted PhoX family phosphatase